MPPDNPLPAGRHPADRGLDRRRRAKTTEPTDLAVRRMHMRRLLFSRARHRSCCWSASAARASAYPQFQFTSGTTRCSQCHYSPAGGGLITSWGRDESGDTISLGGDGAFLHGLWEPPSWLALGADVRLARRWSTRRAAPSRRRSPSSRCRPTATRASPSAIRSRSISQGGIRGDVGRDQTFSNRIDSVTDRLISNEHYLMWRPSATGPYARIGKFFAPYGLRFVEHIFFVQRYTGFDIYNETYNLSGGYVADDWELHLTLFAPPPESFPDRAAIGRRAARAAAPPTARSASTAWPRSACRRALGIAQRGDAATRGAPSASCGSSRRRCWSSARRTSSGRSSTSAPGRSARTSSSPTWAPRSFRCAA